jgi:hypothetical protein
VVPVVLAVLVALAVPVVLVVLVALAVLAVLVPALVVLVPVLVALLPSPEPKSKTTAPCHGTGLLQTVDKTA